MEKTFVEIVVKIQVNEEVHLGFGNVELVVSRSRTITKVKVVEIEDYKFVGLIFEEKDKLFHEFESVVFRTIEGGVVGQNENGSLKVEMNFRKLQVVGLVLA